MALNKAKAFGSLSIRNEIQTGGRVTSVVKARGVELAVTVNYGIIPTATAAGKWRLSGGPRSSQLGSRSTLTMRILRLMLM